MPMYLKPRWNEWLNDLQTLPTLNIPRCYIPLQFGKIVRRELHFFSDASEIGYGQCTYLRQLNDLEMCIVA